MTSRLFHSRLLAILLLAAPPLRAEPSSPPTPEKPADATKAKDAAKAEAAERFERGLKLFNAGDNAGALAEFKRIEEILPNAVVQYNLGLVYAAMGRSVEAVDALGAAIARGGLSESDLARAEQELREQKARVGRLMVTTEPAAALIEVDGVQVAKTPLSSPIRVSQGTHIVGAVAPGFAPARKEVVVAGDSGA
jgi:tetratricopeptide (TPR) repeat protein